MGLDMFLTKKTYIGAEYKHRKVEAKVEIKIGGKTVNIDPTKITTISESIGYWRKVNSVHNWFVENVQDGEDDCNEYEVTIEQLQTLRDECAKILEYKDKAADILPTQDGFFFGGTDYDEYYFEDIEYTFDILNALLDIDIVAGTTFFYQASW